MQITSPTSKVEAGIPVLEPVWLRIPDAVRLAGFSRSKIYELCKAGRIRSASIREAGQTKGTRLIDRKSLLAFIDRHATGGEAAY